MARSSKRSTTSKAKRNKATKSRNNATTGAKRASSATAPSGPINVRSQDELERYLEGADPVVIDFWAPWCGPCQAMAPIFEEAARSCERAQAERDAAEDAGDEQGRGARVHFIKVNTEALPDVARAFGIRSIPTVAVVHQGEVIDSTVGLVNPSGLQRLCRRARDRAEGRTLGQRLKRLFAA